MLVRQTFVPGFQHMRQLFNRIQFAWKAIAHNAFDRLTGVSVGGLLGCLLCLDPKKLGKVERELQQKRLSQQAKGWEEAKQAHCSRLTLHGPSAGPVSALKKVQHMSRGWGAEEG